MCFCVRVRIGRLIFNGLKSKLLFGSYGEKIISETRRSRAAAFGFGGIGYERCRAACHRAQKRKSKRRNRENGADFEKYAASQDSVCKVFDLVLGRRKTHRRHNRRLHRPERRRRLLDYGGRSDGLVQGRQRFVLAQKKPSAHLRGKEGKRGFCRNRKGSAIRVFDECRRAFGAVQSLSAFPHRRNRDADIRGYRN